MTRGRKTRTWVKVDCNGFLHGAINYLLTLEERAVWAGLICLAAVSGGRPGYIEDNESVGLPHEYIAHELHCSLEILDSCLEKMSRDKAIKEDGKGTIELINFKHYQFTEYDRQKPYRDAKKLQEQATDGENKFRKGRYGKIIERSMANKKSELEKKEQKGEEGSKGKQKGAIPFGSFFSSLDDCPYQ